MSPCSVQKVHPRGLDFNNCFQDIDLFDAPQATIDTLHQKGKIVICYFWYANNEEIIGVTATDINCIWSAGSYETGRPDSADFPSVVLGNVIPDWPEEKYLDIRRVWTYIILLQ